MINQNTSFNVKNRSAGVVVYRIPETNIRRTFAPGEVKKISFGELEKLTFQPGGKALIEEFLQIIDNEVTTDLNIHRELEYDMSEAQVKDLLLAGSLDSFLDALDFAPIGVQDLIKTLSVSLPLTDLNKRRALKDKTGFDVDKAILHLEEERAAEQALANKSNQNEAKAPMRRVNPNADTASAGGTNRRTVPNYKVVTTL